VGGDNITTPVPGTFIDLVRFWEGRRAGLEYEAVHYGIGYGGANWQVIGKVKGDFECQITPD